MCNPAIGMAIMTTAMSVAQQKQAQSAQLKAQKIASAKEDKRYLQQASAERVQEAFEAEQRAKEMEAAAAKVRAARATARTAAGESGVSGNSVDLLLDSYTKQGAALRLGLKRQGEQVQTARMFKLQDFRIGSEMNKLRINQPVSGVDYASAIGNGISTYSSVNAAWSNYKATKATPPDPYLSNSEYPLI